MKIIRFFAVLFTVLSLTPLMVHALSAPSVSASSAVLIDASSGRILYGKNENERHYNGNAFVCADAAKCQ